MVNMFDNCNSLISIPDISKWKINKYIIKKFIFGIIDDNINLLKNPLSD